MLPRRHRLTSPEDFRAVLRGRAGGGRRRRAGTDLLVVHLTLPDQEFRSNGAPGDESVVACSRAGFVVSRAVGNSVVRHRVVRRLRAQVAQRLEALPAGTDLVVRALPPSAGASSDQLGAALDAALDRSLGGRS